MENQKERIWLRLKLDLLPCIAQEVDRISLDYMDSVEKVRAGDRLEYKNLVLKQANIRTRIEEFEKFYDKFYADYRIGYFEKLKLRLRKLLSPHIDVNKMIYLETQGIRKAEIMQRRAQSKEKDSLSPNRNNDDSISSKPSFIAQQKLNGSSSSAQQSNLFNLQQQAKQMYQKKIQGNSQQQAFMQLQEPNDSQTLDEIQKNQQNFNNNLKNYQKNESPQAASPQRIDQIIQKPLIKSNATRNQNASKSPTPIAKTNQANVNKNPANNQPKTQSTSNFTAASKKSGAAQQKAQELQQNQKSSVDELVFTIRMTKEDYLKYLQQKSQKSK
ncbi:hypothetical protein ABPG72_005540 [Tetrahymena utriculariae]